MTTMTIWKFRLRAHTVQHLSMPVGARILSCGTQGSDLCVWALVNPDEPKIEERTIMIYGTGSGIAGAKKLRMIGTVQQHTTGLVWHIFEEAGKK